MSGRGMDGSLESPRLIPIAIDVVQSGIAIHAGGTDKSGNYVIFFPPKQHPMIATHYAFGTHLEKLLQYYIGLTTYTGVYRKKFTFYADLRNMNFGAAESIVRALTVIHNKNQEPRPLIESLLIVRPKDKKSFKALQKIIGILSKTKSDEALNEKPPYQIHILTDVKELHRKVDVSQLPLTGGGYMPYSHEEFTKFIKRFEETRLSVQKKVQKADSLLDQLEKVKVEANGSLDHAEKSRIEQEINDLRLESSVENLDAYKASLLDKSDYNQFSQIPSSLLIEVAITVIRDCKDEIKKRGDRFKLLDRHFSLLSPKGSTSSASQILSSALLSNSKRPPPLENIEPTRTPHEPRQAGQLYTAKPRHPQKDTRAYNLEKNPYKSSSKAREGDLSRHRSLTDLRSDPDFEEPDDGFMNKPYSGQFAGSKLRNQELAGTYVASLPESKHRSGYNQSSSNSIYRKHDDEEDIPFRKQGQLQKSAPNLADLDDDLGDPILGDSGMGLRPLVDARGSYDTLDDILSPTSNFSYSSAEANSFVGEDNAYEVLPSPVQPNASTAAWDDYVTEVPREGAEFEEDPSGYPVILRDGRSDPDWKADPRHIGNVGGVARGFHKSVVINDDSETGHELLRWFRTNGLRYLEKNQEVPESAADAEQKLEKFETQVVPKCLAKLEQAEEWLQECERSVGRIWDELQTEINSFRKSLQRVRHQYECVDNFFRHVRKAMHWYQMIVKDMPAKLLDDKRKPDPEKLKHYGNLSDEEHDQMKAIKQKYPHLSPAIANGINKHMIYITNYTIRMQARQLVQRCILVDKLINIYSQDANDAIKTIYQSRRGPNSLPTPDHSQTSSRAGLDDDSLLGHSSPVTLPDEGYHMARMGYAGGYGDDNCHYSSSPPVRSGRTGRLPNKTSRHNRSLPNFSPFLSLGGTGGAGANGAGRSASSHHSPGGASVSPTYSNRSNLSTSSTASSSNTLSAAARSSQHGMHASSGLSMMSHRNRPMRPPAGSMGPNLTSGKIGSSKSRLSTAGSLTNLRAPMDAIHEHPF